MKRDLIIIAILSIIVLAIVHNTTPIPDEKHTIPKKDSLIVLKPDVNREFGFATDSFSIQKYKIESGDNLSVVFEKLGFGSLKRHELAVAAMEVIDVKKIRLGAPYALVKQKLFAQPVTDTISYFVYEPSPTNYVVIEIGDSIKTKKVERKLIKTVKEASGLITSSLWNAMKNSNLDPLLAVKMADIYAWSIDFFGLQKGDKFKLVYEETTIEGNDEWYKLGKIQSAVFSHLGKEYFAIPFDTGKDSGYYDEKGNSLKTFFLKAPLNFSRISSKFSNSRLHPILKIYRPHHGVDYSAPTGTPVHSVANGVVIVAGYGRGAGNWVKIKHDQNYETAYMHLHNFAKGIKKGARVSQGQLIGYVGNTGLSTGPHLDFRFWKNGKPIDPLKVIGPPSLPVPDSLKIKFDKVKTKYIEVLGKINYPQPPENDTIPAIDSTNIIVEDLEHD